ncbi:putative late blight resistance protein homolog R1A-10 [Salvia hispanica]|uniref:putative late blight resistance protein homolog R1A-10 n=1 Tax=Salvia hispanica TaxID=49212 RepID=UPI002009BF9D|nr:putative late blight resistance protein homolog R1A-10 [Salvia hispanica]XP_047961070.1 putative late blight resistance protein homolog R1A-10 [Salvia hispanica]
MTTYGALISLQNTIDHILHSSRISLVGHSIEIIVVAYKALQPLKEILERLDSTSKSRSRKKVNDLDLRIKERVWDFEDLLESLISEKILSQSKSSGDKEKDVLVFAIDLQGLQGDVGSLIRSLKDMEEEYIYELENMAEDNEASSSMIGFSGTKSKMIGLWDELEEVKMNLLREFFGKDVFVLVGMAGVGKTIVAKKLYQDPQILSQFECRAWVTIGRKPRLSQVSQHILAQLIDGDGKVGKRRLKGKKCLVVLDDVWEREVLDYLISNLPPIENGFVQILVTARDRSGIINITSENGFYNHPDVFGPTFKVVRFLSEVESKKLLCEKVFGEPDCPHQLDKAATKIAKKCEGLPLMILAVADILSKSHLKDDPNYWDEVAEERNAVFKDAYEEITEVFFPSYDYLPQYLKMPFLYKGVFPHGYDFPPSKIMNMLTAEGWFLHTSKKQSLEGSVWECLHELCTSKNLVLFNKKSIFWHEKTSYCRMYKICRLHSTWRHVCRGEASKNKFYQVLKKLVDDEDIKGHRCLCFENNILFGIKGFCKSVELNYIRSVLFLGPYHQYPIPVDVGFSLLRELDALNLRFYTFPSEILALVHLKYLALTCNGQLPATISKLFNLRVLIVHPHVNIKRFDDPSYVPIQIWDMQELEHIEILGKSLLAPHHIASLENLLTLVGVNANIGTILELSRKIPSVRKLRVQIELRPRDDHNDLLSCFRSISTLESLETLKCCIINPVIQHGHSVPTTHSSLMMPRGLIKLHLSGMGFPWNHMDVIGSNLPFLQVLKLRSYAFLGSKWDAQEVIFPRLDFLLIEDSDLVFLNLRSTGFPKLSYLSMKHCYKLKEICWPPVSGRRHRKIELVDCSPSALNCAQQLLLSQDGIVNVIASTTFDEKPVTSEFQSYGKPQTQWPATDPISLFFSSPESTKPKQSLSISATSEHVFWIAVIIFLTSIAWSSKVFFSFVFLLILLSMYLTRESLMAGFHEGSNKDGNGDLPDGVDERGSIPDLSDEGEGEDGDGDSADGVEERGSIPDLSDEGEGEDGDGDSADGVEERGSIPDLSDEGEGGDGDGDSADGVEERNDIPDLIDEGEDEDEDDGSDGDSADGGEDDEGKIYVNM